MANVAASFQAGFLPKQGNNLDDTSSRPYWARSHVQCARNLLEWSPEPIEYDHEDEDSWDNCFFFPEDCARSPSNDQVTSTSDETTTTSSELSYVESDLDDTMTPELPDIKMLDTEALGDLLEDNLSPPEITSILVFATNGAIFAYASDLQPRHLRNLSATYGAAYTSFARTVSTGNLTGVNPASHPSSFVTAPSLSLGDVGAIVFENDNQVAVVTKVADKVLLAAVGPSKLENPETADDTESLDNDPAAGSDTAPPTESAATGSTNGAPSSVASGQPSHTTAGSVHSHGQPQPPQNPETFPEEQYEIDRSSDLARLAALNLSSSPEILLALESKSAALGRFLGQRLHDLETPDDF